MPPSLFGKSRRSMESERGDAKSVKSSRNPLASLKRAGDHLRPNTAVTSTNREPGVHQEDQPAGTSVPIAGRANQAAQGAGHDASREDGRGAAPASQGQSANHDLQPPTSSHGRKSSSASGYSNSNSSYYANNTRPSPSQSQRGEQGQEGQQQNQTSSTQQSSDNAEPSVGRRQQHQSKRTEKVMQGLHDDEEAPNADGTTPGQPMHTDRASTTKSSQFDFEERQNVPVGQLTQEQRTRQEHIARQMGVPVPPLSAQTSAPSPRIGTQYQRAFEAHEAIPTHTPGNVPAVYEHEEHRPTAADSERLATQPDLAAGHVPDRYKFKDSDVRMPLDVPGLAIGDQDPMAQKKAQADKSAQGNAPANTPSGGETRRPTQEDRSMVSKDVGQKKVDSKFGTHEERLEHKRERFADYAGWRQVGGWHSGEGEDQGSPDEDNLLTRATMLDDYISNKYLGDWYQNTALVMGTALFAWIVGRFGGSLAWLSILLLFSATAYRTSIRRLKRNYRDDVVREMSLLTLTEDKETMEWLNSFLVKFWLIYEPSLSQMITEIANQILEDQTPPMVQSLTLEKFTLGTKAPRIEFVRSFPRTDPTVAVMDFSASFTPNDVMDLTSRQLKRKVNPKVQLGIRIGKGFVSKSLPVLVEDMSFTGTMRFRIKMMPRFPHIQTVDVSFISPPNFDFVLKPVGGDTFGFDINIIPGLSKFIKEMVHANLGPMFYAPNAFQVNIEQLMAGVGVLSGVGVLTVTIDEAIGLRRDARDHTCDPYIRILDQSKQELGRTKIKTDTTDAVFKENIPVIITNLSESLLLEVMDFKDKHNDRSVGIISVPLERVLEKQGDDLVTNDILSGGRPTGKLSYSLHYSSVQMPEVGATETAVRDTKSGILNITVHGARNLDPSVSKIRELSTFCEIEMNGDPEETTKVVKSTNDPDWEFNKEIIIANKTGMFMVFRVRHQRTKKSTPQVGLLKIRLQELLLQNEKGRDWFPLENGKGDLHISTQWKPCAVTGVAGASYVEPIGMLRLFIKAANDLRNLEHVGKVDPYIVASIGGRQVARTEYFKGTLNPVYDEALYIPVQSPAQVLKVECFDVEVHGNDRSLGSFDLDLEEYIQKNHEGELKVFASDQVYTQRLVMEERGPKGSVSFGVEFYPSIHIVSPHSLDKLNQSKKELQEIKAKKQPTEEDTETAEVLSERIDISGVDMPLEKQLQYNSGVVAITIEAVEGLQRGQRLRATKENNPMPIYLSPRARGKRLVIGDSFDYLAGQLDLSSIRFEVIEGGGDEEEEMEAGAEKHHHQKVRADICLAAKQILEESYFDSKTYEFPLKSHIKISLSARYFPTPDYHVSHSEDLSNGGILEVSAIKATDVEAADPSGTSDPYIGFYLNNDKDRVYKTKTIKKTLNPVWNERFTIKVEDLANLTLKAVVSDWDMGNRDDPLGGASIDCSQLQPLVYRGFQEPLSDKVRKGKDKTRGKEREGILELGLKFIPGLPPVEKELGLGGALGKNGGKVAGTVVGGAVGVATKPQKAISHLLGRKSQSNDSDSEDGKQAYSVSITKVWGLSDVKEIQVRTFSLDNGEKELFRSKNVKVDAGQAEMDDAVFDFESSEDDQLGIKVMGARVLGHKDIGQGACDLNSGEQDVDLGDCTVRVNITKI